MSDLLPLHPKLVHLPLALAVLLPLISAVVLLAWWRATIPRRIWWGVVALQLILVGSGVAALRSGNAEGERVEHAVPEAAIETHEEAAEQFLWAAGVALLVTFAAALPRRERLAQGLALAATVTTLVVLALGYRTGQAGGALVYQHGAAAVALSEAPSKEQDD